MSRISTSRQDFHRIPPPAGGESQARSFIKSLLLLAMALLAALFSNTSARSGHLPVAVMGALVALALAFWVTWRFVPRLAAAVEWEWLPFLTTLRFTREGWVALAATGIVAATAINTSNNLLYMIFSALAATLILSVVFTRINLRSLALKIRVPAECHVRETFPMTIEIRNRKRVFPAFSIRAGSDIDSPFRFATSYFPIVGPREAHSVTVETGCSRRGLHRVDRIKLESRYPFGFFVKAGSFPVAGQSIAFPEIRAVQLPEQWTPDMLGSSEHFQKGQGTDLYLIRDYQSTDSARLVDWKASAKTAGLKTREFTREETRRVTLIFDRYGAPGDSDKFEELVSEAASVASQLVDNDVEVGLISDEWTFGFGSPEQSLRALLRYLALVEMTSDAPRVHSPFGGETIKFSLRS